MHSNKIRQRKMKNQPPPPKILEKLKRDQVAAGHLSPPPSQSKLSLFFHLLLFFSSVSIGFFGFSFFFNPYNDTTFVPFGYKENFSLYEIFDQHSIYWSTLIPGHYFGLRSARPNSTLVSFMWFRQKLRQNEGLPIRHLCRHEDRLNTYYWNYNDLHNFGHQTLIDDNLHINTSFIRLNPDILISKIQILDVNHAINELNSIILYIAAEDHHDNITLVKAHNGSTSILTQSKESGNYRLNFNVKQGNLVLQSFLTINSSLDKLEQNIKANLFFYKHEGRTLFIISNSDRDESLYKSNFIAYQLIFNYSLEIDIEMLFNDSEIPKDFYYEETLNEKQQDFQVKFDQKFKLTNFSEEMIRFGRIILSSTIGSIGYYYGYSLVDSEYSHIARPYGPIQLLAVAPSRSVFPRGFLWDEGFHQLLISKWDPKLSMAIIKSWLSLMNEDGWIPREVILGDEAMSRVPKEFIVQHSSNANPPSLLFAIESLIDSRQFDQKWLNEIYPRLNRWFNWFNTTQINSKFPFTFRWRGRNSTTKFELNPRTLSSGFDDYPRATHPTDDEIHIDLRCWMALATRLMSKIAKVLNLKDDFEDYYQILSNNQLLEQLHWSEKYLMFCDKGLHSTNVRLKKISHDGRTWMEREVLSEPIYDCVAEFGYVNLFPFIMTLLKPDNPKLLIILENIENPELLWTPYGLRSLTKTSSYYKTYNTEHDPPYWRGSIWININYLVLRALNHYSKESGPYQDRAQQIYSRLKTNLVNGVYWEFVRSGFVWEQYDDNNGRGKGAYPFTGWTSLIVQIMCGE